MHTLAMNTITYRHYYTVSGKCLVRNYPDSMLKRNLHTLGASHDLEPTVCITVSRRGGCFWDGVIGMSDSPFQWPPSHFTLGLNDCPVILP